MKKILVIFTLLISCGLLASCGSSSKDGGGGGGGISNTPLVSGDYATYRGNYTIESFILVDGGDTIDSNNAQQIIDVAGGVIITDATDNDTTFTFAVQMGGNVFFAQQEPFRKDVLPTSKMPTSSITIDSGQTMTIVSNPVLGVTQTYVLKKVNDSVSANLTANFWNDSKLCYKNYTGVDSGNYENCYAGTPPVLGQGLFDNTTVFSDISNALFLIGNYYIDTIEITEAGASGCNVGDIINRTNDNLVGELAASARLVGSVNLDIALKFQSNPTCNLGATGGFYFAEFKDVIPLTSSIPDLDKIFADEGLIVTGVDTIAYTPKEQQKTGGVFNGVYEDRLFNGAKIKISLKKARDGKLNTPYAKPLTDVKYY